MFRAYHRLLSKYPMRTQIVTASGLAATGDVVCQLCVEKNKKYDVVRTLRFAAITAAIAPGIVSWYRILERIKGTSTLVPLKRVIVDQIIAAPLINAVFIYSLHLTQSFSPEKALTKFKNEYVEIMINAYKLWPWVQLVNFYFVPLHYRLIFVQCFALIWNTYLSFATHRPTLAKENITDDPAQTQAHSVANSV